MQRSFILIPACCLLLLSTAHAGAPNLQSLGEEFFQWRAVTQPATADDIVRVERPDGWVPDWSGTSIDRSNETRQKFRKRLQSLSHAGWTVQDSVDFLLLRSAIARVDYELNVVRSARRNPEFYVQQTLGAVFELLLQPPPFPGQRARNIVLRLQSVPQTLNHARENLTEIVPSFARITRESLSNITPQLEQFSKELKPLLPREYQRQFLNAVRTASDALGAYAEWLNQQKPQVQNSFVIGPDGYNRFLKEIALLPYTAEEILQMGQTEWERSVAFDHFETLRNKGLPQPDLFPSAVAQREAEKLAEEAVRKFLVEKDILDVPAWMGHYWNLKLPGYIEPLRWLGVTDDLTSATRLGENAISYIPEPSANLPFFRRATAQDPRPILVHEGVPGHFFQLALSWAHADTLRRHFFDSGPIEGIGFYTEEMMLQQGYFDDKPGTREIIYRFMRLRALRVDVDVKLARGDYTIEDAARYLEATVPMDAETAAREAAFFASTPGQAISYQIGKMQIIRLIADAKIRLKEKFSLRTLHNFVWSNGNVPIALQRWEYLGLRDELHHIW